MTHNMCKLYTESFLNSWNLCVYTGKLETLCNIAIIQVNTSVVPIQMNNPNYVCVVFAVLKKHEFSCFA